MRSTALVVLGVLLGGSPAFADDVPPQCTAVATVPADAKAKVTAIAAKVSLATCGAMVRFGALKLAPDDASIAALTKAAQPSFDLLDAVIKSNDATYAPIAQKARADLLLSMAVRMRNTIPPVTPSTVGPALVEHDKQHAELEPKIKPWLDQAK